MNGEKLSLGSSYRSVTMPFYLQADLNSLKGKEVEAFAFVHSGVE